jgi:hypothetical protein
VSEHYCKSCKTGKGSTCTLTGATHTTGIECPSFRQKESEMFKVGDRVRVVADEARLAEISLPLIKQGQEGQISDIGLSTYLSHLPIRVLFEDGDSKRNPARLAAQDLELVEPAVVEGVGQPPIRTFESGAKDINPKDALAGKKAPLSTLPTAVMYDVALAMLEGARKYGRHNYRVMGVLASVYYDAAMGHITSWWEGEDIDPKSGLHHLDKAMASLAVVRDGIHMENWVDDRPPQYPDASKMMRDHPAVATILENYPDCVEPYTEKNKKVDRTAPTEGGS